MATISRIKAKPASPLWFIGLALCSVFALTSCNGVLGGDQALTQRTYFELVDWHISGLWVINCPVCWVRVVNYNNVPIKHITFQYNTYDYDGTPLDQGTSTIEESVLPGQKRDFIELYVGFVNLHSEKLSLKLLSVDPG